MGIPVSKSPSESLETIAYEIVHDIPTREPNDRNRLAYHVYLFLKKEIPTLDEAIQVAQTRTTESFESLRATISARIAEKGFA